jgi:hypothetical protein
VTTEEEHHVLVDSGGGPISTFGPDSVTVGLNVDLRPGARSEVEPVEIVSIVTIIATKDIHTVLIDYGRVTMARGRCLASQASHFLPRGVIDIVFIEVVDSIEAVVASKYVY